MVGNALCDALTQRGDDVWRLRRNAADTDHLLGWDGRTFALNEPGRISGCDAVIHLAGEPILGRWTTAKKARIKNSRVHSTAQLARQIAAIDEKPACFLTASAIGFYGSRGEEVLTENHVAGNGFLADVCQAWEAAATPARAVGVRVAHARFGMLLDPRGGALKTMRPPFSLGLGGRIGSGEQYMSWATLADAVRAILCMLDTEEMDGPANIVAPHPCTNREFTRALGQALRRPTWATIPAPLARLVMGEMAESLLLSSQRVIPEKLTKAGFAFSHPTIGPALETLLQPASG